MSWKVLTMTYSIESDMRTVRFRSFSLCMMHTFLSRRVSLEVGCLEHSLPFLLAQSLQMKSFSITNFHWKMPLAKGSKQILFFGAYISLFWVERGLSQTMHFFSHLAPAASSLFYLENYSSSSYRSQQKPLATIPELSGPSLNPIAPKLTIS